MSGIPPLCLQEKERNENYMTKKKQSKWDKISGNCKWIEPCDCGETDMCYNPKGEYDRCNEDDCPLMKKKNG